ncbi:hypothetical protein VTL71DRAFT_11324 [Oculimacula yallundae]|uniref:Uncharacterized protein n=1 Tax=Oculimacula yallundae TaxID=86028 RepID=A0ABR4CPT8_9HELO
MADHLTDLTATAAVAPSLPLTDWARKYGRYSFTDHKSGLTPIEYVFARSGGQSNPDEGMYEEYQRSLLRGFTTRELGQLDCLPTRELITSNLPAFILPMLRIEHWETTPAQPDFLRDNLYPLANGQGMWVASNPVVWSILQPILALATKMLTSLYVLPWFDALLNAPRVPIPPDRLEQEDQVRDDLYSFRPRPLIQFRSSTATTADRDRMFNLLSNQYHYTFGFMSPLEDPTDPAQGNTAIGVTATNRDYMRFHPTHPNLNKIPKVFTFLDLSELEHILRGDLNSAEKMCIEWGMANTIAHEVMHAIDYVRTDLQGNYGMCEPYFDLEALPELGYSFEQAINLGSTDRFVSSDALYTPPVEIPPLGFFLARRYPDASEIDSMSSNGVVLKNPGVRLVRELFPIPIAFYEDMQQEEFWSVAVRNFGHGLLHYRSKREGTRIDLSIERTTGNVRAGKYERFSALNHTYPELNNRFMASVEALQIALTLTPEERGAMEFGRNLLIASRNEQSYWDNSAQQQAHAKAATAILASARNKPLTRAEQRTTVLNLTQCMVEAISNHQVQIAAVQSLEALNKVTYPDRRSALKIWNRGTRVFLNDLKGADQGNHIEITALLLNLEIARMVLYDPTDPLLQTSEEYVEIQSLQLARFEFTQGNFTSCRNVCLGLVGTNSCSIFACCGAAAILFALDQDVYKGWDERKRNLIIVNEMLIYCMAAAPANWIPLWRSLKTELMDVVNALQKPLALNH